MGCKVGPLFETNRCRFREPGFRARFRNSGFREPGFGARFQEPKVPQTRLSSKVLGTMGSGYLLGSGTSRFRDPQVLGARKVPGTLGFRQGSGNLTMVSSGSGITGTPILKHPGNPEFGERGFRQGSSNTGFRQGSENHRGCGPTVWVYFRIMPQVPDRDKVAEQQFSRSPAQVPENQGSGKVPRFRKQPRGRIYAVGCTKVHATDRVPENQFSRNQGSRTI